VDKASRNCPVLRKSLGGQKEPLSKEGMLGDLVNTARHLSEHSWPTRGTTGTPSPPIRGFHSPGVQQASKQGIRCLPKHISQVTVLVNPILVAFYKRHQTGIFLKRFHIMKFIRILFQYCIKISVRCSLF
jgi:hypothetical protein